MSPARTWPAGPSAPASAGKLDSAEGATGAMILKLPGEGAARAAPLRAIGGRCQRRIAPPPAVEYDEFQRLCERRLSPSIHKTTGEIVAVKVLRTRHADSDDVVEHFMREGQVGKKLRHPNIVAVYDYGEQDRAYYIVMEFVEGNNLKDFVRIRKRLEPLE